jgi:hypothetical protein
MSKITLTLFFYACKGKLKKVQSYVKLHELLSQEHLFRGMALRPYPLKTIAYKIISTLEVREFQFKEG